MLSREKKNVYVQRLRQLQQLGLTMPLEYGSPDIQCDEVILEQCDLSLVFDLHERFELQLREDRLAITLQARRRRSLRA